MAIRFLLSLIMLVLAPWQAFASPKFPYTAEAVSDRVNIRSGENNNFEIVASLNKGDRVIVTGKSYSWFKVRLPDGAKVYIKSEYLRLLTPEVGEVLGDRVNVRAAPNTNATILGQVIKGSQLFVKEVRSDGWIWVKPVDELNGWVQESFLVFKSNQILPTERQPAIEVSKKANEPKVAMATKPAMKLPLTTKLANGLTGCAGKLFKVEGTPPVYQVFREGQVVCSVQGPSDALEQFMNRNVIVQGKANESAGSAEAPMVTYSKITLSLQ
jgi:uncharacterized protein YgiM (DUF1202 family)